MTPRRPWYAQCRDCGERWKAATLPMEMDDAETFKLRCPRCGAFNGLRMRPETAT